MTETISGHAEETLAAPSDDVAANRGCGMTPRPGAGGAIAGPQAFFRALAAPAPAGQGRFTQAPSLAHHSHTAAPGIGLAPTRRIVQRDVGRLAAWWAGPDQDSELRFLLPVQGPGTPPAGSSQAPAAAAAREHKRGLILIADDNVDAAWGIARLLEIAGFSTLLVRGGHEALKEAEHQSPDVAIIDIDMPDLSGYEVARQIRRTQWGRHMVLIAATGWGQESDERQALEAGFDAHVTKPVDLRKLSALVDDLLLRPRP